MEAKPSLAAVSSRTYQTGAAVDLTLPESPTGNGDLTYSLTGLTGSELTFDASTRKLTGTVSTVAVYNLIYTVVDSDSNEVACTGATPPANCDTASVAFTLTVVTDIAPTLAAVAAQSYLVGATVDLQLPESPTGNGTLTYNLTGHRGAGLTFDASTRTLSGAPTVAGVYSLTYRVTDGDSNTLACTASDTPSGCDTASAVFTLTIEEDARPTLASTDAVAQTGVNGQPLATITLPLAADGNFGLTGVLTGTLDGASVSVAEATGVISLSGVDSGLVFTQQADSRTAATITGRPTADGTYALIYTVVDGDSNEVACTGATPPANCDTALVSVTLTVVADSVPVLAAVSNIIYPTGSTVDQTLPPATGGNGDLTYSLTGLTRHRVWSFNPATRKLTGTPITAAPYSLTYTAMDCDTNSSRLDSDCQHGLGGLRHGQRHLLPDHHGEQRCRHLATCGRTCIHPTGSTVARTLPHGDRRQRRSRPTACPAPTTQIGAGNRHRRRRHLAERRQDPAAGRRCRIGPDVRTPADPRTGRLGGRGRHL